MLFLVPRVVTYVCVLLYISIAPFSALAAVEIQGVKNSTINENIQAHIGYLDTPTSIYQYSQYKQQLVEKVNIATQVYGYYHVQVQVIAPPQGAPKKDWSLKVDLGQVTKLREVVIIIDGEGAQDSEIMQWKTSVKLKQGSPLEHALYDSTKSQLQSLMLSRGYFDSEYKQSTIKVYESLNVADITLHMNTGIRYKFGELQFGQDARAKELVTELLPFKTGDFYVASQLGLLNRRVKQTQYFTNAIVRPLLSKAKDFVIPIEVILTHKPRDNFDVGAGVSSDVGPRFTGKWQRPWANSSGHSVGGQVYLSEPEQYISLNYKVPLEDAIQNYLSYQVGYQAEDDNDTDSEKWSISATRHWTVVGSDWQRSAFLKLEQETFTQGLEEEQTTRLLIPGMTISRLRSRGGLDINWGDKQTITVEVASDSVLSDINLVRILAKTKWVRSLGQHRFQWRIEVGGIVTNDFDQVPSSLRFFTGGDQSVRGFDYNTLSPFELDDDGEEELIGGQFLAVASFEYSYPVSDSWRAAVFIDGGNATDNPIEDYALGAGIGAIWNSPIGPVRFYLAKGKSDFGFTRYFHLSMGPSL
ncbi:autotransporter assembly complex protein TamA [Paraglaciecola marina]|uniref:autotransporter assembly complex protein TamA n=1 Tax=Paraglaciecola marina TaxID=2500157 RepID=UPI0010606095|nr:autotransporter assembly complex family protein [Paraglaciecola marina]